jgi:hypothetical protein
MTNIIKRNSKLIVPFSVMVNFQSLSVIFYIVPMSLYSTENNWFSIEERPPIAYVKLEILEGTDMKPSDINGENNL